MKELQEFPLNSLFLKEREDLLASSLLLEPKDGDSWSVSKETLASITSKLDKNKNWTLLPELKNLKTSRLFTWEKLWDHSFLYPTSYFFSHSLKKLGEEETDSTPSLSDKNLYLRFKKSTKKTNYSWANQYLDLVDLEALRKELIDERQKAKEENLLSELTKLDLIRQFETFDEKLVASSLDLEKTVTTQESAPQVIVEWKPPNLEITPLEIKLPLPNCLPSMFLSYVNSKDFARSTTEPLKAPPEWLKKLSSLGKRWSIAKYIPEERTKALFSPPDLKTLTKQNVQWQDPEEKWHYYYLPLITLFFDKFRERYKKSLITTWEEQEYTFPLTEIDLSDSLDPSRTKDRPIFVYEGIPSIKIGRELELIQSIIDRYSAHYEEQAKKEFAEEGFAPVELSQSLSSTELLNEMEKENNIV